MRIAYVVPSLIRSGPIRVVHQLAHQLAADHEVTIFYLEDRNDRELLEFSMPTRKIDFSERIDFSDFDIVHSHTIKADLFVRLRIKKGVKTSCVTTLHNYAVEDLRFSYGNIRGTLLAWLWRWAIRKHDAVVVLSKNAEQYYKKLWSVRNIHPIYNGVECPNPVVGRVDEKSKGRFRIGVIASAGGVNRRKGIDQIICALKYLPNFELHVAGKKTSESSALEKMAKENELDDRVFFHGYVSNMGSFISSQDVIVVSSRSEGFPLSLQEAVCMKKPVVCSDLPIFREIFSEDEVCFFELENIENLAEIIERCYKDGESCAKKACDRYLREYTPKAMAKNYLKLYRDLYRKRRV